MRKLSFLLVFAMLALVSTTTFAQDVKAKVVKEVQDKVEIQISELPEAVTKTLGEQFADYAAEKAYKMTKEGKEVYYVKLVSGEKYVKVLLDAEGNVLESKEPQQKEGEK